MYATKKREFHTAFIVDDAALEKLDQLLREFGPSSYTVSLADGLTLSCGDLLGLRQQTNSEDKPITEILASTPWQASQRVAIRLRKPEKTEIAAIDYDMAGEEKDVYVLSGKLDQWIAARRPVFAYFARSELVPLVSIVCTFALFTMILAALPANESAMQQAKTAGKPPPVVAVAPLWAWVSVILGLLATWLRNRLMPVADFAIGDGAKRSQRLSWWRNTIILATALGIATNILSSKLLQ